MSRTHENRMDVRIAIFHHNLLKQEDDGRALVGNGPLYDVTDEIKVGPVTFPTHSAAHSGFEGRIVKIVGTCTFEINANGPKIHYLTFKYDLEALDPRAERKYAYGVVETQIDGLLSDLAQEEAGGDDYAATE